MDVLYETCRYSFALMTPGSILLSTQSLNAAISRLMTSLSMPARRHIRTRSAPGGTVGGTTGLTMKPFSRRNADRACGVGVNNPRIGDNGLDGMLPVS